MQDVTKFQCFEDVEKVLGYTGAKQELEKVVAFEEEDVEGDKSIWGAFTWNRTPQGSDFWISIIGGRVPEGYKKPKEGEAVLKPFYVNITGLTRNVRVRTLMALLRGKVDAIEFSEEGCESEWEFYDHFGVVVTTHGTFAQFWSSAESFGFDAVELTFEQAVQMLDGEVPDSMPMLGDMSESCQLPNFRVAIGDMDNADREAFIHELQDACRDEVEYVEYDGVEDSWHCWEYVGISEDNELEFWDSPLNYGGSALELAPYQALELVRDKKLPDTSEESSVGGFDIPDFDFKIRNADNVLVRQWLEDNGFRWKHGESLTKDLLDEPLLKCDVSDKSVTHFLGCEDIFEKADGVEISVSLKHVLKAAWIPVQEVDHEEVARQARIKELEEELASLKAAA